MLEQKYNSLSSNNFSVKSEHHPLVIGTSTMKFTTVITLHQSGFMWKEATGQNIAAEVFSGFKIFKISSQRENIRFYQYRNNSCLEVFYYKATLTEMLPEVQAEDFTDIVWSVLKWQLEKNKSRDQFSTRKMSENQDLIYLLITGVNYWCSEQMGQTL